MYVFLTRGYTVTNAAQYAMRKFLDQHGVSASADYDPQPPEEQHVRAYEDHGLMQPNMDAPRICLTQNLGGKWNKALIEMLTTEFISAVKEGKHKPVEHTWPQMQEGSVRKRLKTKLYLTQRKCITRPKNPASDKLSRMHSRRQDVCVCF
jgi:hypothetical protein